jgi:2-iminobutanoate/2-iminopropanoate deaminase
MSNHRETVTAAGGPGAAGPYSHAVKAAGLMFISGQVHVDPESGQLVGDTPGDQARRCLDNLAIIAGAAGTSLADAARNTIYCTDISVFGEINEAYGAYWDSDPPARVTIGVAALPLGAQLEMDAVIALPD